MMCAEGSTVKPSRSSLWTIAALLAAIGLAAFLLIQQRIRGVAGTALMRDAGSVEAVSPATPADASESIEVPPSPAIESILAAAPIDPQRKEADPQDLEILVVEPDGAAV